jgi:hypothetical protein
MLYGVVDATKWIEWIVRVVVNGAEWRKQL